MALIDNVTSHTDLSKEYSSPIEETLRRIDEVDFRNSLQELFSRYQIQYIDVQSWSLTGIYYWHSLIHKTYVVAELKAGKYIGFMINHSSQSHFVFGREMSYDYFSQLVQTINLAEPEIESTDFMYHLTIEDEQIIQPLIVLGTGLNEVNQLAIIESLLKDE